MKGPLVLIASLTAAMAFPGCTADGVREFTIHVGWNADGKSQYMTPSEVKVHKGDKVRFIVVNDDDPNKDYNGDQPQRDNFHDVALRDYDGDGDGAPEDIEHEVPAGETTRTCLPQAEPDTKCAAGKDFFKATTTGTFRIICEVNTSPSHDALGMHASFVVE